MVLYYRADCILPVTSDPVLDGVVAVEEDGRIIDVYDSNSQELAGKSVQKLDGIIVPGFINSHCHLELSHLHGKIAKRGGLIPFIKDVIGKRDCSAPADRLELMKQADKTMFANGIVAVGDISNTDISQSVKEQSSIYYHTYIEVFGFDPAKAKDVLRAGILLKEKFGPSSLVPHAPYSVSKDLFREINALHRDSDSLYCIHNQESAEENTFYRYKKGKFLDFYADLKLNIDFFKPQARNSIQSITPLLPKNRHIMFVHNTYTGMKDLYFMRRSDRDITWCFCPNANLYIEGRLPKIEMFLLDGFNITLGTDSLASNDELSILSELKTLQAHFPELPLTTTIKWATLNGARFLYIDDRFGSIEKGKKPGLNLISGTEGLKLTKNSRVRKLI